MIVQSFTGLQALTTPEPRWGGSSGSLNLYDHRHAYAEIYRTQPNVRICADFLARNVAQCAIHAFRRVSDTDRVRLPDHDLIRWIEKPNPATRRYRLIEALMSDLAIYFEAYWLKVRYTGADGRDAIGLVRLPPEEMEPIGGLLPAKFYWTANGRMKEFPPSEIVYFNGYNPCSPLRGLSPLETLRRILAEESAAGEQRESFWRNSGRMEGVIEQSDKAPDYSKGGRMGDFRGEIQKFSAGGERAGMTAILPRGMTIKPWSFSAKDSEYIQGGKLRREVCAAEYHIPQPMVGILDHATFSNIREQHKHTYQDTLAPWMEMITQEIEGQLLIECDDQRDVYIEFNIAAKLAGTFEERASALQISVGRPWRTVNEARAIENLPRIDDPEMDRVAPQQGGPSDATAQPGIPPGSTSTANDAPTDDVIDAVDVTPVIYAARVRQFGRFQRLPPADRPSAFFADIDRWNRELTEDLTPLLGAETATQRAIAANAALLTALAAEDA